MARQTKPRYKRWEVTFEFLLPRRVTNKQLANNQNWRVDIFAQKGQLIPTKLAKIRARLIEELNVFQLIPKK